MFPQVRFQNEQKKLWNPVTKKPLDFLPEERVRLEIVEYLNRKCGFSYSRISTESQVKLQSQSNPLRSDILVYDKNHKPYLLVECKAPHIKLKPETAVQIARYNTVIHAPYLLVTNGTTTYRYQVSEGNVTPTEIPFENTENEPERDIKYWQVRGFIGKYNPVRYLSALESLYNTGAEIAFMNIPIIEDHPDTRGYFALLSYESSHWAISFQTCEKNNTWCIGVHFEKGMGTAIFSVNIETGFWIASEFGNSQKTISKKVGEEDSIYVLSTDNEDRIRYFNKLYKIAGLNND